MLLLAISNARRGYRIFFWLFLITGFSRFFISSIDGKSVVNSEEEAPATATATTTTAKTATTKTATTFCEVPFASKVYFRYQWPLIFQTNGSLYPTTKNIDNIETVLVAAGDEVLISCGPNYVKKFGNVEAVQATCNGATGNFTVTRKGSETAAAAAADDDDDDADAAADGRQTFESANIKELSCDLRVIEEVINNVYGCPEDMTSTNFGYVDPVKKLTIIIGEACYDTNVGRTLFAHVKLGGHQTPNYLQKADRDFLVNNNHPNARYKIDFFRSLHFEEIYDRVRKMLNVKEAPGIQIDNFVDGPLLSHNQLYATKKLPWNYFIVRDNLYILDRLKENIKDHSKHVDLDIYVGSHGVNVLRSSIDVQMELYASIEDGRNRFPMPEMIWILVKNQNKATAFGVFNDPKLTADDVARKSICKSECEKITWLTRVVNSKDHTPVVCCRYEDFRKVVKEVPVWSGLYELYT